MEQLLRLMYDNRPLDQQPRSTPLLTTFACILLSWRELLTGLFHSWPPLFSASLSSSSPRFCPIPASSARSAPSSSLTASAMPLATDVPFMSVPFPSSLFTPYVVYCVAGDDHCGGGFFRHTVQWLSVSLSIAAWVWVLCPGVILYRAQSLCSCLWRSMVVFCCAAVLLSAVAVPWTEDGREQSGASAALQSVYLQPVAVSTAPGSAAATSHSAAATHTATATRLDGRSTSALNVSSAFLSGGVSFDCCRAV